MGQGPTFPVHRLALLQLGSSRPNEGVELKIACVPMVFEMIVLIEGVVETANRAILGNC